MGAKYGEMLGEQLGTQAASGALGGVMDMLFQPWRNRQQQEQNAALLKQNVGAQKELGEFNYEQQLKMWNATNSEAQMKHLKDAGLNPALMYGGGGGGGSTVAGGQAGSVSGAVAPMPEARGMGMNILMPAQVELMRAQARNLDADTAKKAGVETELGETTIEKLKADTANVQAQTKLTQIQGYIARIDEDIKSETQGAVVDAVKLTTDKIMQELMLLQNQTDISDKTKENIINTVNQEYLNKVLEAQVMKQGIAVDKAQIHKMGQDILIGWKNMGLEERKTKVQELMGGEQKDEDQIINIINGIVNGLILKKFLGGSSAPVIKGFRR